MRSNLLQMRRLALLVLASGGAAFLAAIGFIAYCAYTLPLSHAPAVEGPPAATAYATGAGSPFAIRGVYHGEPVTADHLPDNLAKAVVAIEDRRFYSHHGIDLRGIGRSAWHNLTRRGGMEGGSTITQQLARVNYLSTRTLAAPQGPGGHAGAVAGIAPRQARDPRALPERGLFRRRRGRRGCRREALFRQKGERPRGRRGGDARRADPRPLAAGAEPQSQCRAASRRGRAANHGPGRCDRRKRPPPRAPNRCSSR